MHHKKLNSKLIIEININSNKSEILILINKLFKKK